jgi:hypothetical protein
MRESEFVMREFAKGLRPFSNMPLNSGGLTTCYNYVPRPEGLVGFVKPTNMLGTFTVSPPFPQLFYLWDSKNRNGTGQFLVVCTKERIYTYNGAGDPVLAFDCSDFYSAGSYGHYYWQVADFIDYIIFTNRIVTITYTVDTNVWAYADGISIPNLGCVCAYNGQILASGSNPAKNNTAAMTTPYTMYSDIGSTVSNVAFTQPGNIFMWSNIGSASFIIGQDNVAGYMPLKGVGNIQKILPIGTDKIVVYGDTGIVIGSFKGVNFSPFKFINIGIMGRAGAAGNSSSHMFVDSVGNLYHLTAEMQLSAPMYKEFIGALDLGFGVTINFLESTGDFYIAADSTCFVRTAQGLGQVGIVLNSIVDIGYSEPYAMYKDLGDTSGALEWEFMDFERPGGKTITGVEIGCRSKSDSISTYVNVQYSPLNDSYETSPSVEFNNDNYAKIEVYGNKFGLGITTPVAEGSKIDYVVVKCKFDDKRHTRGRRDADQVVK